MGNASIDECAIRVLATVVSHISEPSAVIDAGSKTLSQDGLFSKAHLSEFQGHGMLVGFPEWQIERLSEEHGAFGLGSAHRRGRKAFDP